MQNNLFIYQMKSKLDFIYKFKIFVNCIKDWALGQGNVFKLWKLFYFTGEQAELKEQPGLWKQIRGKILNALEIKICQTLNKDCDLDDNEFVDKIDTSFIHDTCHSETLQTNESITSDKSDKINKKPSRTVYIIDDNNYLSSMRHEFYQENEHYFLINYFEINIQFLIFILPYFLSFTMII